MNPSECKNKIIVTIPDGEHCDRCLFLMYVGAFYHSRYPYNHDKNLSMYKCYYYDEPLSYDVKCDCYISKCKRCQQRYNIFEFLEREGGCRNEAERSVNRDDAQKAGD